MWRPRSVSTKVSDFDFKKKIEFFRITFLHLVFAHVINPRLYLLWKHVSTWSIYSLYLVFQCSLLLPPLKGQICSVLCIDCCEYDLYFHLVTSNSIFWALYGKYCANTSVVAWNEVLYDSQLRLHFVWSKTSGVIYFYFS